MVQEYLENAGGAVSIEDNMGNGTVVTVSLNPNAYRKSSAPEDTVLQCGPRRSSPHIPIQQRLRSSPWQRSRCSPRGTDAAARNASCTRAPGGIDVDAAKRAQRGHAAGGSGCSSNAAGDGGTGGQQMGYQPYQQGYPYQQMPPLGYGQQFPQQYQQGYQQPYQQMLQQQYNPGPADASAALPTVASKFSTAGAAHAEFSTTSSSNDVS